MIAVWRKTKNTQCVYTAQDSEGHFSTVIECRRVAWEWLLAESRWWAELIANADPDAPALPWEVESLGP
jgi:hypothetical protein